MSEFDYIADSLNLNRRFFGRRKSKALPSTQQSLYDKALQEIFFEPHHALNIQDLFPETPLNPIILEIGFGGGEHLLHQAQANPHINYLGIDAYVNSVSKAVRNIYQNNLKNIRLSDQDAYGFIKNFPKNSLDGIYLLYPDPWPKKKYRNRRFMQRDTAQTIEKILKPDGFFRFATDIPVYAEWTIASLINATKAYLDIDRSLTLDTPLENWTSTRYEQKALREGRTPAYYQFLFAQ